jgi:hypothetical protein
MMNAPEPWLRGADADLHPSIGATLFAFQQAREDLEHWTEGFSDEQMWLRPHGLAPLAFHIRHIAGSVERLATYLEGRQLSEEQLRAGREEEQPAELGRNALFDLLDRSFASSEAVMRGIDPSRLADRREVGRKRLPTTAAGLLTHIAEHTARHVGEAIITAKLVRQAS